jgi:3-oxoacyl-[acyl-carrier-protein] synthase-3
MLIPSHGVMVHGELGTPPAEVVSFAGSCCTGIQALKYAYYSVLNRETNNAVCVASERISAWMRNQYFEVEAEALKQLAQKPILAFEKEFLRWMLSDGAAAALIHPFPAENTLSFIIEWIEIRSYAGMMKTCMYAGAEKNADGNLDGWASFPEKEWLSRSIFSLKQDTRLLEEHITRLGGHFLKEIMQKRKLIIPNVNWFLPHLSSMFFKSKIEEELKRLGINIPEDKWFINLPSTGNVGSASFLLMLEGLHSSGKLKKGDKILCMVPESARFSYGFCLLTAH